ncbi:hypothetical protein OC844_005096 [Tilletia horrida]|nr:hypothetical protein OC844_005096 [Tilletia horrida]
MADAGSEKKMLLHREPAPCLSRGLVTHIEDQRALYDHTAALAQWHNYVAVFGEYGWEPFKAPYADNLPDSVFVEDTVVAFAPRDAADRTVIVLTNPGADERKGERVGTMDAVERLQAFWKLDVHSIEAPGTLDGGDVLKDEHSRTVYCGIGGRTNAEGIQQLRGILKPFGYVVKAVPMTKALHLKSAATALPDGTVLLHRNLIDDVSVFPSYLEVPEEHGVAVVALDDHTVIMSADAPKTAEMIRARGYKVKPVDISQFERLEGCVTCLSVRIRRLVPL